MEKNTKQRTSQIFGEEKKENNLLYYAVFCLAILLLFSFLILANYKNSIFNYQFYNPEYEKNGIYHKFNQTVVSNVTIDLFMYLNGNANELSSTANDFFSERDKIHLKDVKYLISISKIVYAINVILFLLAIIYLLILDKSKFKRSLAFIFIITAVLYALFFIVVYFNQQSFASSFTQMHYLLFDNDYWILDPQKDNLINLYPQQFWFDITQKILVGTLIYAVLFLVIGINILLYIYFKNKFFSAKKI